MRTLFYFIYETRDIREIVNMGISKGELKGWRQFKNARTFGKYGRQRGWERVKEEPVAAKPPDPVQLGFTVVETIRICPGRMPADTAL